MLSHWLSPQAYGYRLAASEDKNGSPVEVVRSNWRPWTKAMILVVVTTTLGYYVGSRRQHEYKSGLLAPAGTTQRVFVYDRTFSMAPTNRTERAWHNLFPDNGGFIHHPNLASNFSGLSVYHQLHCLKAIYSMYYDAVTPKDNDHDHKSDSHSGHKDHSVHARHCFDYLRQSLLCLADTNLEPYNYTLDGVTGWGPRTCRNHDDVFTFANKWGGGKFAD